MTEKRISYTPQGKTRWDLAVWRVNGGDPYGYVRSLLNNPDLLPSGILYGGEDTELVIDRQQSKRNPEVRPLWEAE